MGRAEQLKVIVHNFPQLVLHQPVLLDAIMECVQPMRQRASLQTVGVLPHSLCAAKATECAWSQSQCATHPSK